MASDIYHIAIDGPTAAGKGTVAKSLATRLGIVALDTGAMYRGTAIYMTEQGINLADEPAVTAALAALAMKVTVKDGTTRVSVNGTDVTDRLRDNETSVAASIVATYPAVRAKMVAMQKDIAKDQSFILEGRDICNIVLPDARYKFLLAAKVKTRAERRRAELAAKGKNFTLSDMVKQVKERDLNDRKNGGFKKPKGAVKVDSTRLTTDQVTDKMLSFIRAADRPSTALTVRNAELTTTEKPKKPKKPPCVFRRLCKIFLYIPFRIVFWTRVINKRELKQHKGKPVVFCCNHRSNSDVPTLFMAFPGWNLNFMGKKELFENRFMNWVLTHFNGFPVEKGKDLALIRQCLTILRRNHSMMMFPEGMRVFNPEDALAMRSGSAMIAIKAGVPLVPIVTNRAPRPFRLTKIKVGKTISTEEFQGRKTEKADLDKLSRCIGDTMSALLDGYEKKPRPKKWETEESQNVRGIVIIDNKLLTLKRNKGNGDYFVLPGGHVDEGENHRTAVVRELKEETNANTSAHRVLYRCRMKSGNQKGGIQTYFLCDYKNGEIGPTDAEEYSGPPSRIGYDGTPRGTYEPTLVPVADLKKTDLKPAEIKRQLVRDLKKYGPRLSRPTIFIKS